MLTSLAIFYHLSLKANIQSIRMLSDHSMVVQYKLVNLKGKASKNNAK